MTRKFNPCPDKIFSVQRSFGRSHFSLSGPFQTPSTETLYFIFFFCVYQFVNLLCQLASVCALSQCAVFGDKNSMCSQFLSPSLLSYSFISRCYFFLLTCYFHFKCYLCCTITALYVINKTER